MPLAAGAGKSMNECGVIRTLVSSIVILFPGNQLFKELGNSVLENAPEICLDNGLLVNYPENQLITTSRSGVAM